VPYILLTEGVFKALAGCSNGIPTISLLGVEQGLTGKARDPENQRFLVPALRKLAEAGFGFIIALMLMRPQIQMSGGREEIG
jgi:putative DNA primase/helicase